MQVVLLKHDAQFAGRLQEDLGLGHPPLGSVQQRDELTSGRAALLVGASHTELGVVKKIKKK